MAPEGAAVSTLPLSTSLVTAACFNNGNARAPLRNKSTSCVNAILSFCSPKRTHEESPCSITKSAAAEHLLQKMLHHLPNH